MATYTVFVPAPKGESGMLPVTIQGTANGKAIHHSVKIPYDKEITGVPEPVAKYVEENHGARITLEKDAPKAAKAKGRGKGNVDPEPTDGSAGSGPEGENQE